MGLRFSSGTEALLHEYSLEQQKLREKQRMLKSDWERFKQQVGWAGRSPGSGRWFSVIDERSAIFRDGAIIDTMVLN